MKKQLSRLLLKLTLPLLALALISIGVVGCDEETRQQANHTQEAIKQQQDSERNPQEASEPTPAPSLEPIDLFYSDRHGKVKC